MPRKSMFFTAFSPVNAQGCKHIVCNGLSGALQGLVGTSCHVHPGQKIVQAQQGDYQQMAAAAQKYPARRLQACRMSAFHRAPLHPPTRPELCSAEASPVKTANSSGSEFLRAVGNVAQDRAWEVMDELMDTLKIVNEKAYNSVLK